MQNMNIVEENARREQTKIFVLLSDILTQQCHMMEFRHMEAVPLENYHEGQVIAFMSALATVTGLSYTDVTGIVRPVLAEIEATFEGLQKQLNKKKKWELKEKEEK